MDTILKYPDQFLRHRGRDEIAATLASVFPNFTLDQLKPEPEKGRLMYFIPPCNQVDPLDPPYLTVRFHDVLKLPAQMALLDAWDALHFLNVKYPKPEPQCSKALLALHLGVWETYRMLPIVTSNSRDQPLEVISTMDNFLSLVGQLLNVPAVD